MVVGAGTEASSCNQDWSCPLVWSDLPMHKAAWSPVGGNEHNAMPTDHADNFGCAWVPIETAQPKDARGSMYNEFGLANSEYILPQAYDAYSSIQQCDGYDGYSSMRDMYEQQPYDQCNALMSGPPGVWQPYTYQMVGVWNSLGSTAGEQPIQKTRQEKIAKGPPAEGLSAEQAADVTVRDQPIQKTRQEQIAKDPLAEGLTAEQAADVIEWLVEGGPEERRFALGEIIELVDGLSNSEHGSRVVQRALEEANKDEALLFASKIQGHVWDMARSRHGNHILTMMAHTLLAEDIDFMVQELKERAVVAARHRFGCRVLQKILEVCPWEQVEMLAEVLMTDVGRLVRHPFANCVIKELLEVAPSEVSERIFAVLMADPAVLAKHRIARHVLMHALEHLPPADCDVLAGALANQAHGAPANQAPRHCLRRREAVFLAQPAV